MLPERMRDVVRWRLRQLSAVCMRVLSAASALGDEFDIGTCRRRHRLRRRDPSPRTRRSASRRRRHRELAPVRHPSLHPCRGPSGPLSRARAQPPDPTAPATREGPREPLRRRTPVGTPVELAHHFYLGASAGGVNDALRYLRLAADDALQQVAYEAAADHLGRALELVTDLPSHRRGRALSASAGHRQGVRESGTRQRGQQPLPRCVRRGRNDAGAPTCSPKPPSGTAGCCPAGSEPNAKARALLESALVRAARRTTAARAPSCSAGWPNGATSTDPGAERQRLTDSAVDMARRLGRPRDPGRGAPVPLLGDGRARRDRPADRGGDRDPGPRRADRRPRDSSSRGSSASSTPGSSWATTKRRGGSPPISASWPHRFSSPSTCASVYMWDSLVAGDRRSLRRRRGQRRAGGRHPRAHRASPAVRALLRAVVAVAMAPGSHGGPAAPARDRQDRAGVAGRDGPHGMGGERDRRAWPGRGACWPASCPAEVVDGRPELPLVVPHGGAVPDRAEPRRPDLGRHALRPHRALRRPQLPCRARPRSWELPPCSWGVWHCCSGGPRPRSVTSSRP